MTFGAKNRHWAKEWIPFGVMMLITAGIVSYQDAQTPSELSLNQLGKVASEINGTLPLMVDHETELFNVMASDRSTLTYSQRLVNVNSVDFPADVVEEVMDEILAELLPTIRNRVCTTPDTRKELIDRGVAMEYQYYDAAGIYLGKAAITPAQCDASSRP